MPTTPDRPIYEVLRDLRGRGAFLTADGDNLEEINTEMMTPRLWNDLRNRKAEILDWLRLEAEVAPPELAEVRELLRRLEADRQRLAELVLQQARRQNYPAVRLAPWARFQGGQEAWERQVKSERTPPSELFRFLEALIADQAELAYKVRQRQAEQAANSAPSEASR